MRATAKRLFLPTLCLALASSVAPARPGAGDPRGYERTIRACLAEWAREGHRGCFRALDERLQRGELDQRAFYRAVDRVAPCDERFLPVLELYDAYLARRWVPEARLALLRCIAAGNSAAWTYAGSLFRTGGHEGDPTRLTAEEWRRVHALCVAQRPLDCLAFVGTAPFDRRFQDIRQERAFVDGFDDGRSGISSRLAGMAACRIAPGEAGGMDPARSLDWNLGFASRCARAPEDREAVVRLTLGALAEGQSDEHVSNAMALLGERPEVRGDPRIEASLRACSKRGGPRSPCHIE